eukprot:g46651.t1
MIVRTYLIVRPFAGSCFAAAIIFCAFFPQSSLFSIMSAGMQNDQGEIMDLYIPRKCSASNKLLKADDHASVQINIGKVDASGWYQGEVTTVAFSGFVRRKAEADWNMNKLMAEQGLMQDITKFRKGGESGQKKKGRGRN